MDKYNFGPNVIYFAMGIAEGRPTGALWADKANPSPMPQSLGRLQGGGDPSPIPAPLESEGGGNREESWRHSHSLLTLVG